MCPILSRHYANDSLSNITVLPGARHLHWLHVKLAGHSSSGLGELGSQSHPGSVDMCRYIDI